MLFALRFGPASYVNHCDLDLPNHAAAGGRDNLVRLVAVKRQ